MLVTGLHIEQGFCVRFPAQDDDDALETWEDWEEIEFLAEAGTVIAGASLDASVIGEAQEVLDDAEDGCHLHLHESDDD